MNLPPTEPVAKSTDVVTSLMMAVLPPSLHRIVRFGLAGAVATLAYFLITNVLVLLANMPPVTASVCAYLLSLGISYILQSRFTFKINTDSPNQVARFVITSLAGLLVSWCVMAIAVDVLSWSYFVGTAVICVLIPLVNYFVFRGWVFATHSNATAHSTVREP
jgi:putative flippase GtrA